MLGQSVEKIGFLKKFVSNTNAHLIYNDEKQNGTKIVTAEKIGTDKNIIPAGFKDKVFVVNNKVKIFKYLYRLI